MLLCDCEISLPYQKIGAKMFYFWSNPVIGPGTEIQPPRLEATNKKKQKLHSRAWVTYFFSGWGRGTSHLIGYKSWLGTPPTSGKNKSPRHANVTFVFFVRSLQPPRLNFRARANDGVALSICFGQLFTEKGTFIYFVEKL